MKSIFQYKQYDIMYDNVSGSTSHEPTILTRNINDMGWVITPIGKDYGEKYHKREINLNLLENKIDSINYQYSYFGKTTVYEYEKNIAYIRSTDGELGILEERKQITFNEFCNYIKENEKYISV